MSSSAGRVIKNTGWLYGRVLINTFLSLYTTRIILNGLGAADFGIFNIVGGAISMLGFLNAAMSSATQRYMSYAEGKGFFDYKGEIFNSSYVLHFVISLFATLILIIGGFFFFNGILSIPSDRVWAAKIVYGSLIVSTAISVISVPYNAVITSHENMRFFAITGIFECFLKLGAAYACIISNGDKLIIYGILMAIIPFITLFIMRFYCHINYTECKIDRNKWNKDTTIEIARFAGWNFLGTSSSVVGNYGMGVVINHFFGVLVNAASGINQQITGIVMTLSRYMLMSLNPVITKAEGAGNRERMLQMSATGNKFSFFILTLISIPFFIETDTILKLWLVNVPEWTVIFVKLQIIRIIIEHHTIVYHTSLNSEGHIANYNKVMSIINILPILLSIIVFYLGAEPYAMYLITIAIFGILVSLIRVYFMHINCGLSISNYIFHQLIPCLLVTLFLFGIGFIPFFLLNQSLVRLLCVIISLILFGSLVIFYIGLNRDEKILVNNVYSGIKKKYLSRQSFDN